MDNKRLEIIQKQLLEYLRLLKTMVLYMNEDWFIKIYQERINDVKASIDYISRSLK